MKRDTAYGWGVIGLSLLLGLASTALSPPLSLPSTPAARVTIAVDIFRVRQTIDGFGAAFPHQATDLMTFPEPARSRVVDLLFSTARGAGLSILRSEIGCGNDPTMGTIEPTPGRFDFSGDRGQVWLMRQAERRGPVKLFSTVWSPPAWMKTNGNCTHGGYLVPAHDAAFARYLSMYVRGYRRFHGLTIAAVSPSNEPNAIYTYQSSQWSGQGYHDFFARYLGPTFARDHVTATVVMPESFWNTDPDVLLPTLRDPASARVVGVIAGHGYHHDTRPWGIALAHGKRTWQTEISYFSRQDPGITDGLYWAWNIHAYLTRGGASAWLWWWGTNGSGARGDGEGLIYLTRAPHPSYIVSKRLYTIGNYSRFIRPGDLRVDAPAHPAADLYTSVYRAPDGRRVVVVAINEGRAAYGIRIGLRGTRVRAVTPYVTSATRNLSPGGLIAVVRGGFSATLPARSVTTFVGSVAATARRGAAPARPRRTRLSCGSPGWTRACYGFFGHPTPVAHPARG